MKDNCEKCGWPMTITAGGDEMHCGRKYYHNDYAFCLEKQNDKAQQENKQLKDRIKRLEEALELVLKMRNDWLKMRNDWLENQEDGYEGAYYAFVKGNDSEWEEIIKAKEDRL